MGIDKSIHHELPSRSGHGGRAYVRFKAEIYRWRRGQRLKARNSLVNLKLARPRPAVVNYLVNFNNPIALQFLLYRDLTDNYIIKIRYYRRRC